MQTIRLAFDLSHDAPVNIALQWTLDQLGVAHGRHSIAAGMSETEVVISGAGAGIGRASALAFAEAGALVVAADVTLDNGYGPVEMIGSQARFAETDIADGGFAAR